jgi:thioester reductase-like protein
MSGNASVLLTGSTGFFGTHLLAQLLESGTERVLCHVRASSAAAGFDRIVQSLKKYELWQDSWRNRIRALPGDLGAPQLGLGATFRELPKSIDAIFHNGAQVNYVLGYAQLKPANVGATQEVLRLAQAARCPLYYVSTLRLFDYRLDGTAICEDDAIDLPSVLSNGYAYSKAMAERMVVGAQAQGIDTTVFRPGLLCGGERSGVPNPNDAISLLVRGCVQMGAGPLSELQVNLTSVDYAARALVALACDQQAHGRRWHLVNDAATPVNRLLAALNNAGFGLELLSYERWVERLMAMRTAGWNDLLPLAAYFTPGLPEQSTRRVFDSTRTRERLVAHGVAHPSMDDGYLRRNVEAMVRTGFLPSAGTWWTKCQRDLRRLAAMLRRSN